HRANVVGQLTKALLAPCQCNETALGEFGKQVFADLAIEHLAGVSQVAKQEGDVKNAGFGYEIQRGAGRYDGDVDSAKLQAFNNFALAAQGAIGELLDLEIIGRAGAQCLGEGVGAGAIV